MVCEVCQLNLGKVYKCHCKFDDKENQTETVLEIIEPPKSLINNYEKINKKLYKHYSGLLITLCLTTDNRYLLKSKLLSSQELLELWNFEKSTYIY